MTRWLACVAIAGMACGPKGDGGRVVPPSPGSGAPVAAPVKEKRESWRGTLVLPVDLLDIVVEFVERAGVWTATLEIPTQNVTGIALAEVVMKPDEIRFTLVKAPESGGTNEQFVFKRTGDTATGKLTIGGQSFFGKLVQLKPGEPPRIPIARPQTPEPPYPYEEREVTIDAPSAGMLAGTMTVPKGKGPFPAVVLISGSGQQDRDQTIFGHRPFRVLADRLTRDGFVVLRTDDRGVGKTRGAVGSFNTDISDGRAAFEWLAKQRDVDPKRVGMIGHSVGGIVAPTVAARTKKVAFVVALAGPGVPGAELVALQMEALLLANNTPPATVARIIKAQRTVGAAIVKGDAKRTRAALKAAIVESADAMGQPKPDDAALEAAVTQKLPEITNPWTVSFFKTDPAVAWRKVKVPVLAVIGDKDLQVPADVNLRKMAAALKAAGNRDVTTSKRPGLNHLYQHATTGSFQEYGEIEETFDPDTLELVAKWLAGRAHIRN